MEQLIQSRYYSPWQLIKAYWQSQERVSAYLFSLSILAMTVLLVGFDVVFNYWYNYFYNDLQAYDVHGTVRLLIVFIVLAAFNVVLQVYRYYLSQLFGLRWRRWLTTQLLGRWLDKHGYYYLESFDEKTDNPDQRIQDDAGSLVMNSIELTLGLVSAVTTFPAFVFILWTLSGVLTLHLGPLGTWHIYGYLVWAGVLYNIVGTLITFKVGRPLVGLNFQQQQREASFRFAAIDMRSHAENVALYRGERHQKSILQSLFGLVLDNWYAIILRQKMLLWFTGAYNQTAVLLPLLVALPNYFGKVFLLGGLMQSLRAFGSVQESLSFLINAYTQIAQWRAVADRLTTFLNHLNKAEENAQAANQVIFKHHADNTIVTQHLTIHTPRGDTLLTNINEVFTHGKNYLIKGPSGMGKSTFIRVLAGIWPYACGEVTLPQHQRIMYLPQKSYMPIGTLAEAMMFPDKHNPEWEQRLESVLEQCHLEEFKSQLQVVAPWSQQLSPGELQRIAFARVLLHKPDWVFLDETTSMLDLANETYLYQLLREQLPSCSIVSVGHRPTLDVLHDHIIDLAVYS